jgi:hypothetical protein
METLSRKGSSNEADALSRRPELNNAVAEEHLLEKDVVDIHIFLSCRERLLARMPFLLRFLHNSTASASRLPCNATMFLALRR